MYGVWWTVGTHRKDNMRQKNILILASLIFLPAILNAGIIMQPYLQAASQNSIYILAECDSKEPAVAEYGVTEAYGLSVTAEDIDTNSVSRYVHKIKVTGLAPGTTYHYRVLQGQTASGGRTFKTAPEKDAIFSFSYMADCQERTDIHGKIAALMLEKKPDFSIYGGDICSSGGYTSFKDEFFIRPELELISRVPFFLSPGNHEGWSENTKAFTRPPDSASGTNEYYSFDWGAAHFLVLNTEVDFKNGSKQYKFAIEDLAASGKKWKIAVFHKPAYAQGGDWFGEPNPTRALADNVLSPGGVQLVLSGHMHYYQHNVSKGTHYLVVSPAGGYKEKPVKDSYTVNQDEGYHFAVVDVDASSLRVLIYNEAGERVDEVGM